MSLPESNSDREPGSETRGPEARVPFQVFEPAEAKRIFITQSKKAATAAKLLGLTATAMPLGAESANETDWSRYAGQEVIVLPKNEEAGRCHAQALAGTLTKLSPAPVVKVLTLDHLPEGGDISDWIAYWDGRGRSEKAMRARIEQLADEAEVFHPAPDEPTASPEDGDAAERESAKNDLMELASRLELFHTPNGDAYATVSINGHREHWRVNSNRFKGWLRFEFYRREGQMPPAQAFRDALLTIEGKAVHGGACHEVYVRLAEHQGDIYVDLCNDAWQAVRITPEGWSVVDNPPVRFRRAKAMLPLPTPLRGGSVADLKRFLNMSEEDWPLIPAWLLAALRPRGPYPVLVLCGVHGSSKSTVARVLRKLLDPNAAPLRCSPRDPRDLMIAANNGWVICLDNISHVPPWLSDALCRLSTGGGFATRRLYTDDEEIIFDSQRPVVITGIEEVTTREDLLDRVLVVSLPMIADHRRLPESEFWRAFDEQKPQLFAALLTAVSQALGNLPNVSLDRTPRMADFAIWATAGEAALGLTPGQFLASYRRNRQTANEIALECSPITRYIFGLLRASGGHWQGQAQALLRRLEQMSSEGDRRLKSWPKTPRGLSGALRRLAPNLREVGVHVDFGTAGSGNRKRNIITMDQPAISTRTRENE